MYRITADTIYDVDPLITLDEFRRHVAVSYGSSVEMEIVGEPGSSSYVGVNRVKVLAEDGVNMTVLNVNGAPGVPCRVPENDFSFSIDEKMASFSVEADAWRTNAFFWEFSDGTTSTEQNPIHEFDRYGQHGAELQVSNECGSRDAFFKTVDLGCPAVVNPSIGFTTEGTTVSFRNLGASSPLLSSSYAWSFGDGATSADRDPVHTYEIPGSYEVTLQELNECSKKTVTTSISIVITEIPDDSNGSILVFPNPSTEYVMILSAIERITEVSATTSTGLPVHSETFSTPHSQIAINTQSWSPGVYILKLSTGSEIVT